MSQPSGYLQSLERFTQAIHSGEGSMAIYQNNTLGLHSQALAANFQVTRQLLGQAAFDALARVYSQHFPADHWDINLYGEQFSHLIAAQASSPKAGQHDFTSAAAMATLEYAILLAYYADNSESLGDKVGEQQLPGLEGAEFSSAQVALLKTSYPFCHFPNWWAPSLPSELWRQGIDIHLYQGPIQGGQGAADE